VTSCVLFKFSSKCVYLRELQDVLKGILDFHSNFSFSSLVLSVLKFSQILTKKFWNVLSFVPFYFFVKTKQVAIFFSQLLLEINNVEILWLHFKRDVCLIIFH